MNKISLEKIRVYAFHGVIKEEQYIGSYYEIDISIKTNFIKACINDNLDYTINYSEINDIIHNQMKQKSNLLENVAFRIIKNIYETFNSIEDIYIKIAKINPPIIGDVKSSSIEINLPYSEFNKLYFS